MNPKNNSSNYKVLWLLAADNNLVKLIFQSKNVKLSGSICAYYPGAQGSMPKHKLYAF